MKKITKILLTILLSFGFVGFVNADTKKDDIKTVNTPLKVDANSYEYNEEDNKSLFIISNDVTYKGKNDGISFIVSNSLKLEGNSEYLFTVSKDIKDDKSNIEKDAFVVTSNFKYDGSINRDAYIVTKDAVIDGTIGRNLYIVSENLTINGTVKGNIYVTTQNLKISDDAKINGTIRINDNAIIEGNTDSLVIDTYKTNREAQEDDFFIGDVIANYITKTINMILVGFVLLFAISPLFRRIDKDYKNYKLKDYALLIPKGCAMLILIPIVALLVLLSSFGVALSLLSIAFYAIFFYVGLVIVSYFIGKYLSKLFKIKKENEDVVMALGVVAYQLIALIPIVDGVIGFIVYTMAFGYLFNLLFRKSVSKKEIKKD